MLFMYYTNTLQLPHYEPLKMELCFSSLPSAPGKPFLLYMAFQHTHHPQYAGEKFTNSSIRGKFGDALVCQCRGTVTSLSCGNGNVLYSLQTCVRMRVRTYVCVRHRVLKYHNYENHCLCFGNVSPVPAE